MSERPTVHISVEVGQPLEILARPEVSAAARSLVESAVAGLMGELGIQAAPSVDLVPIAANANAGRPLRLKVNGRECPYPVELPLAAFAFLESVPRNTELAERLDKWINRSGSEESGVDARIKWVQLCVLEILKLQCGVLFTAEACTVYLDSLRVHGWTPDGSNVDEAAIRRILSWILNQRTSLANRENTAAILIEAATTPWRTEEVAERLFAALRKPVIEILIHGDYLRQIACDESNPRIIAEFRDWLGQELGLTIPDLRLIETTAMPAGCIGFRFNDVTSMPMLGLPAGSRLIEGTAAEGEQAWQNPVTGVQLRVEGKGDISGAYKWSPLAYLALSLFADVRLHAGLFLDQRSVQAMLKSLNWHEALVSAFQSKYSLAQGTAMLRGLVRERIPVKDLRTILSAAVDFDVITVDTRLQVFDERLPCPAVLDREELMTENLISYVRTRLKGQIGQDVLHADRFIGVIRTSARTDGILLDAISRLLRDGSYGPMADFRQLFDDEQRERLLGAIRNMQTFWQSPFSPTPILTTVEARPWLRRLIEDEFPRTIVLAQQELPAAVKVYEYGQIRPEWEDAGSVEDR